MTPAPDPVTATLAGVMLADRGRIIAALMARTGDFQLAEEALHDACEAALIHWARADIPLNPMAWLIRVAFRKAIDRLRRATRDARAANALTLLAAAETEEPEQIADDRLRLIFTCCHPTLDPKSRIALTLRTICGLTTPEISRAFLDQDAAMGQRLSRAKARIAAAGIGFSVPESDDWPDRLGSVLTVTYLIFNAGYTIRPEGGGLGQRDLCGEAVFLGRLLNDLCPDQPEIEGCLALLLALHARAAARVGVDGQSVPPSEQDRGLWDHAAITDAALILRRALARGQIGPFQIKAAIALCHTAPTGTDWPQILALYDRLLVWEPGEIVQLNRAVAVAEVEGPAAGLAALAPLAVALADYQPFHAARAAFLAASGQRLAAGLAYDRAIGMTDSPADLAFLSARKHALNEKKGRDKARPKSNREV